MRGTFLLLPLGIFQMYLRLALELNKGLFIDCLGFIAVNNNIRNSMRATILP